MSKAKPKKKANSPQTLPCKSCGLLLPDYVHRQSRGLCRDCWSQTRLQDQAYRQKHAVVIAELSVGFTEDLFSSELVIESDGCYIHQVHWVAPDIGEPCDGEQLYCYAPQIWEEILIETESLFPFYRPAQFVMDDIETLQIHFRVDGQFESMQCCAEWQCEDGADRFGRLWAKIHQQSPWFQRLVR